MNECLLSFLLIPMGSLLPVSAQMGTRPLVPQSTCAEQSDNPPSNISPEDWFRRIWLFSNLLFLQCLCDQNLCNQCTVLKVSVIPASFLWEILLSMQNKSPSYKTKRIWKCRQRGFWMTLLLWITRVGPKYTFKLFFLEKLRGPPGT